MNRTQPIRGIRADVVAVAGEPRVLLAVQLKCKRVGYRTLTLADVRELVDLLERTADSARISAGGTEREMFLPQLATLFGLARRIKNLGVPAGGGTRE